MQHAFLRLQQKSDRDRKLSKGLFKLGDKKGRLEVTRVGKVVKIGRTGVFPYEKGKIKILKCLTQTSRSARGLPSRQC